MNSPTPPARFHLGVVTGLVFEANIVRRAVENAPAPGGDTVTVACHGPGPERGLSAARSLIDLGATALLSFGVAGGCNPHIPSGTVVVSTGVRDMSADGKGDVLYTNREWQRRIKARLLGAVLVEDALVASVTEPVTGADAKQALFNDLNVAAVDMESAAIARTAMEAGIPFMALRAVLDDADTSLPPAALAGLRDDGTPDTSAVLRNLLRRPQDLPGLVRLGSANAKAKKALTKTSASSAPLFGAV